MYLRTREKEGQKMDWCFWNCCFLESSLWIRLEFPASIVSVDQIIIFGPTSLTTYNYIVSTSHSHSHTQFYTYDVWSKATDYSRKALYVVQTLTICVKTERNPIWSGTCVVLRLERPLATHLLIVISMYSKILKAWKNLKPYEHMYKYKWRLNQKLIGKPDTVRL